MPATHAQQSLHTAGAEDHHRAAALAIHEAAVMTLAIWLAAALGAPMVFLAPSEAAGWAASLPSELPSAVVWTVWGAMVCMPLAVLWTMSRMFPMRDIGQGGPPLSGHRALVQGLAGAGVTVFMFGLLMLAVLADAIPTDVPAILLLLCAFWVAVLGFRVIAAALHLAEARALEAPR